MSILNALTSGGGVALTGDTSGNLTIQSAGTNVMSITTGSLVGIGTTTPTTVGGVALCVYDVDNPRIRLTNSTTGNTSTVGGEFTMSGNEFIMENRNASANIRWYNNGSERMRINSSGYVAIGTASPSNEAMLHIKATSSAFPQLQLVQDNATDGWNLNATSSGGQLNFQRKSSGGTNTVAYYDTAGSLILSGPTGQKSTGTTWSNPSDSRLKENVTDYTKGLSELNQVNVKTWEYNGKAGTTEGSKGLGVIADEIMQVLPETVDTYEAKLNAEDEEVTDVKRFDATEITWLLVNAVKELNAKVDAQAAEIAALKGA
jgi:hypothetical protein